MDEKITGYHVFFVIFTFFLLTGFVIGTSLSHESAFGLNELFSEDNILSLSFRIFDSGTDTDDNSSISEKNDRSEIVFAFAQAFILDFRYMLVIFLCGFTAFAPVFGIFILLIRGALFGYSSASLYYLIRSGYLFAPYDKLSFICYFVAGAINIILCINICCIANGFSAGLRAGIPLKKLFSPGNTMHLSGGRFTVIFLLMTFLQLCITALRCFLIGLMV